MSGAIPRFSFNNATVKTEEELTALAPAGDKYFREGLHAVTITSAEYAGAAADPNWGKVKLTYTGTGGKTMLDTILIPERDVVYVTKAGKKTGFLFDKFRKFGASLGVKIQLATLGDTMATLFSNVGKTLVGKTLTVQIGYDGNHVAYLGKNSDDTKRYGIKMKDGSMIAKENGEVLEFPDVDSARAHGEALQIELEQYMNVLGYIESKTVSGTLSSVKGW